MTKITVVGTGYVGLSLSVLLAQHNDVIALDIDKDKVNKINDKISPISDFEIEQFLSTKSLNLLATTDKLIGYSNAAFVIVATPTDYDTENNFFNTQSVEAVIKDVLQYNPKATIIIKSTVPVGFTDYIRQNLATEKVMFAPEFLREGQALKDNLHPSRIIIGDHSEQAKAFAHLLLEASHEDNVPIIYTNPIRTIGLEFLSTTLNNSRMLQFMEDDNFSDEDKEWAKESYKKLENRLGEFVNLEDDTVTVETFDRVHPLPKNVGVLIDNRNGSTAEQFLLAAKQSKKVKLFGVTTRGVLDISNMHQVQSPSKHFTLYYSLSKSFRIPEMAIDSKGIQPDYYIDASVPAFQWIDHTKKILETR